MRVYVSVCGRMLGVGSRGLERNIVWVVCVHCSGMFSELEVEQLVALVSCLVCDEKSEEKVLIVLFCASSIDKITDAKQTNLEQQTNTQQSKTNPLRAGQLARRP